MKKKTKRIHSLEVELEESHDATKGANNIIHGLETELEEAHDARNDAHIRVCIHHTKRAKICLQSVDLTPRKI